MSQRYFITAESTYESLRERLDAQLGYPNSFGKSVVQTPLHAPRDSYRRVLLAVDDGIVGYTTIIAAIVPLLVNEAMEELDEATYLAAVASASESGGVSSWNDLTDKPATFAPSAHKSSHATGGSDALTASDIGAAAASHTHTASQITDFTAAVVAAAPAYSLPTASGSVLGGVKIGSGISIDGTGVISASAGYTLPNATTTTLGGIIVGSGLAVSSGTVSVVTYAVRSDTVGSTSYIGRAVSGSATSASVWTIRRTVLTSAGAVSSTTTATNVKWDDRLTATYS